METMRNENNTRGTDCHLNIENLNS